MHIIHVSPKADAPGTFRRLQDAIDSIPADNQTATTIYLAPGYYHEKISLEKPYVSIAGTGDSPADTVISYDDYGNLPMPDGKKCGTFRSYTFLAHARDLTLQNLTIENASGDSKTHGQAIALYAEGDRIFVDSCRLLGHQDTLFTGPLPPKEYQPDGFLGPTQHAPRVNGRQYYKNCYICGDVDFIFGSATAYFDGCTLESLHRDSTPEGYVTAASTPEGQEYGYVFSECAFTSDECPAASVYLGRPWRDFARTVLIGCTLSAHIHPDGFHDWDKKHARNTVFYAEYKDTPVPPPRADFVRALDAAQAAHFSKECVLAGTDGWNP